MSKIESVGCYVLVTGASGAIPRNDIARQEAHARLYYDEIRKRSGDIEAISHNSGFAVDEIKKIKGHMFLNRYDLGESEPSYFDPNYDMAVSWQRLIEGKNIQEMDIIMLRHELMEYELMNNQGMSYRAAHEKTELSYNYSHFVKELDRKEGLF